MKLILYSFIPGVGFRAFWISLLCWSVFWVLYFAWIGIKMWYRSCKKDEDKDGS
jgi:hypothetical protein